VLHFAPEPSLRSWLEALPGIDYLTADLAPRRVSARLDVENMPIRTGSLDVIIASHVLEHVDDDGAAMTEICRALRPGGTALLMMPVDSSRSETFEDPGITTPAEREIAYWQNDHVRLYGGDVLNRLAVDGLHLTMVRPSSQVGAKLARRYGLYVDPKVLKHVPIAPPDEIYLATRGE
jgi:SAM-dependent methyltransferase